MQLIRFMQWKDSSLPGIVVLCPGFLSGSQKIERVKNQNNHGNFPCLHKNCYSYIEANGGERWNIR